MFIWLLCTDSKMARLTRTILQGFIGFVIAYLPQYLTWWSVSEPFALLIMGLTMAVLSPLMAKLGEYALYPSTKNCIVCDAEGNELPLEAVLELVPEEGESNG